MANRIHDVELETVWAITLDGGHDEEIGSVDELGWYALIVEKDIGGYIVHSDTAGSRYVWSYDDPGELDEHWMDIQEVYSEYYADESDTDR